MVKGKFLNGAATAIVLGTASVSMAAISPTLSFEAGNTGASFSGQSLGNSVDTTVNGTNTSNITAFTTNDSGSASSGFATNPVSVGQSVQAKTGGTLTDIKILISGSLSGSSLNIGLYDSGLVMTNTANAAGGATAANTSPLTNTGSNGYITSAQSEPAAAPGTQNSTFTGQSATPGKTSNGGFFYDVTNTLLTTTSITLPAGYNTAGDGAAILDLTLSGADAITLIANHEYVLEFSGGGLTAGSVVFVRQSATTSEYPYGQGFKGQTSLNGNAARDFAVGFTTTPEPTSLAMLGLGSLLGLRRKRA